MPTRKDLETLMWVRSRVEDAMDVHALFTECCDRIDQGVVLTEGEHELFEEARSKIRAASDAISIWEAWAPS